MRKYEEERTVERMNGTKDYLQERTYNVAILCTLRHEMHCWKTWEWKLVHEVILCICRYQSNLIFAFLLRVENLYSGFSMQFLRLPGLCYDPFLNFLLVTGVEEPMEIEGISRAPLYLGKQALLILGLLIQESLALIRMATVMVGHRADGGLLTKKYLPNAVHTGLRNLIKGESLIRDRSGIIHWMGLDEMHPWRGSLLGKLG